MTQHADDAQEGPCDNILHMRGSSLFLLIIVSRHPRVKTHLLLPHEASAQVHTHIRHAHSHRPCTFAGPAQGLHIHTCSSAYLWWNKISLN